jgi:hypothetical protein
MPSPSPGGLSDGDPPGPADALFQLLDESKYKMVDLFRTLDVDGAMDERLLARGE